MNNRAKLELSQAALEEARGFIDAFLRTRGTTSDLPPELRSIRVNVERAIGALLPKSSSHCAGAWARCKYCGRYSASALTLSPRLMLMCECGQLDGWTGAFAPPNAESDWSIRRDWVSR